MPIEKTSRERKSTSENVLDSEVLFLKTNKLGFGDPTSTVIAMRSATIKLLHAYTTSGLVAAGPMLRLLGAYPTFYFHISERSIRVTSRRGLSPAQYVLEIARLVTKCEDAVHRSHKGDLIMYMMEVISLCRGYIDLQDVPERP